MGDLVSSGKQSICVGLSLIMGKKRREDILEFCSIKDLFFDYDYVFFSGGSRYSASGTLGHVNGSYKATTSMFNS